MKLKLLISTLIMSVVLSTSQFAFAANGIKVVINNEPISFDVPPQTVNGRTMVPMRAIFEKLGASVNWDSSTKTITGTKGTSTIQMIIGSETMTINGKVANLDSPATVIDGRTLVPVRAIAESFDCDVKWDNSTKTVAITTNIKPKQTYTSIEGDWVRVSNNSFYGSTMNVIKYMHDEKYQASITSLSPETLEKGEFSIGDIKMAEITPITKNLYTGDSLSSTGIRTKYQITVNDSYTTMEMISNEQFISELSGDYQKWIRITNDTDIDLMQKVSDTLFYKVNENYPVGFLFDIKNNSGTVMFTKKEANEISDNYFRLSLEQRMLAAERSKINDSIKKIEKQISLYEKDLVNMNDPSKTASILNQIQQEKQELDTLNAKLLEINDAMPQLMRQVDNAEKKYERLINYYEKNPFGI